MGFDRIWLAGGAAAPAEGEGAARAARRARASITSSTDVFVLVTYLLTLRDDRRS